MVDEKEVLGRLFYLDRLFDFYTYNTKEGLNEENMQREYDKIKLKAESLPIDNISLEVYRLHKDNLFWFGRFRNLCCYWIVAEVDKLCFEREHTGIDSLSVQEGMKIVDFLKEYGKNPVIRKRVEFILNHFDFLVNNIPVVVREKEGVFEIMSGYHRAMAVIENGYKKIKVLCICDPLYAGRKCATLDFAL